MCVLPGVTILDDGTNPGRIALGGFPAEMSNLQIDGVDVPATGIGPTSTRQTRAAGRADPEHRARGGLEGAHARPASFRFGWIDEPDREDRHGPQAPGRPLPSVYEFRQRGRLEFQRRFAATPRPGNAAPQGAFVQPELRLPSGKKLSVSLGGSRPWRQRPTDDTPSEVAFLPGTSGTPILPPARRRIMRWRSRNGVRRPRFRGPIISNSASIGGCRTTIPSACRSRNAWWTKRRPRAS